MIKQTGKPFAMIAAVMFLLTSLANAVNIVMNLADGYDIVLDTYEMLFAAAGFAILLRGKKDLAPVLLLGMYALKVLYYLIVYPHIFNILSLVTAFSLLTLSIFNCFKGLAKIGKATRSLWLVILGLGCVALFLDIARWPDWEYALARLLYPNDWSALLVMIALWLTRQPVEVAAEPVRSAYVPPVAPVPPTYVPRPAPTPTYAPVRPVAPTYVPPQPAPAPVQPVPNNIRPVMAERPAPRPAYADSNVQKLREYKDLLDDGIITQEEFEAKKKQLLGL